MGALQFLNCPVCVWLILMHISLFVMYIAAQCMTFGQSQRSVHRPFCGHQRLLNVLPVLLTDGGVLWLQSGVRLWALTRAVSH